MPEALSPVALQGVRVVELAEGIAGPWSARLLGDLGAEVLKVERSGGDPTRRDGPKAREDAPHSALFEYLNWNKRGVQLEPGRAADRESLDRLLAGADILVLGLHPTEVHAGWGLDPQSIAARHPHLVVVAISDFGWSGPHARWRGSDLVLQAAGGIMAVSGLRHREPLKPGLRQAYYCAGLNGAYTAMAALFAARRTGHGSVVDLSVQEVLASELVSVVPAYALTGVLTARRSAGQDPLLSGQPYRVSDGSVTLQVNTLYGPERFAEFFDEPRLARPEYASHRGRILAAAELRAILVERLAQERGRELFARANQAGLLVGLLQDARQLLDCEHLQKREVWAEVGGDATRPGMKLPATLGRLSGTPMTRRRAAPALGECPLPEALESAEAAAQVRPAPAAPAAASGGPLAGMRVLDLSTVFAAPYMAALLRDMGAEVIKVEAPQRLDQLRAGGFGYLIDNAARDEPWNHYNTFQTLHRGKRSIVLDLQTEAGRRLLRDLIAQTDILIDNFTPRVMRGWGMTWEQLREINPRLVMLSNTGYGSSGPWANFRAQGTTLEATMGVGAYGGYRGESAVKIGQSYPDFLAAWSGLSLIMAALVHRQRTGQGQWLDLGMYQLGVCVIPEALIAVQAGEPDPGCRGNEDWGALFSAVLPAAGEDEWLAVSVDHAQGLESLDALIGLPADAGAEARMAALQAWARARPPLAGAQALQAVGVAAAPVNNARDLICDEHLAARGFFEDVDFGGDVGHRPLIGRPYTWAGSGCQVRGPAPHYGADNRAVLDGLLKLPAQEIDALYAAGVVVDRPLAPPEAEPEDLAALVAAGTLKEADPRYREVVAQRRRDA